MFNHSLQSHAHIHDTYIASSTWRLSLWNAVVGSGTTLVDVVSTLWTMTTNAITKIKAGVTEFVEGVKAGVAYIQENVLEPMVDEATNAFLLFLKAMGYISQAFSSSIDTEIISNGVLIGDGQLLIYRENLDMIIQINDYKINIGEMYIYPNIDETLSSGTDTAAGHSMIISVLELAMFIVAFVANAQFSKADSQFNKVASSENPALNFAGYKSAMSNGFSFLVIFLLLWVLIQMTSRSFYESTYTSNNDKSWKIDYFDETIEGLLIQLMGILINLGKIPLLNRFAMLVESPLIMFTFQSAIGISVDFARGGSTIEQLSNLVDASLGFIITLLGVTSEAAGFAGSIIKARYFEVIALIMTSYLLLMASAYLGLVLLL